MQEHGYFIRKLDPTIGEAVAKRSFLRKNDKGEYETWGDVAERVALGNTLLHPTGKRDFKQLRNHIASGTILTSGRHLQHGDNEQPGKGAEKFTNCSTASTATLLMYLALNGSGVGTCYDDDVMDASVDWSYCPTILCQLSEEHPDFVDIEDINFGSDFFPNTKNTAPSFIVPDSREGWAHAVEFAENITWTNQHGETDVKFIVLDFSNVRENGAPIAGMQNKPASGPIPLIQAFLELNHVAERARAGKWRPWRTAKFVHHVLTACVAYGGVRRIARSTTKWWRDQDIFDFISIKKNGELWTANNSIAVDSEFWAECGTDGTHAHAVFLAATSAGYSDGTGEPGFLNVDKLHVNKEGLDRQIIIGSSQFELSETTQRIYRNLYHASLVKKYSHIVNPCVSGDTMIMTDQGEKPVYELIGKPFVAKLSPGAPPEICNTGFWFSGEKEVFLLETMNGHRLKATAEHKIQVHHLNEFRLEWREMKDFKVGDLVALGRGIYDEITCIAPAGIEKVYDCSVEKTHRFVADGIIVHNCFEISLDFNSGFCVLCDFAPYHASTLDEVRSAVAQSTRFTIRTNLMESVYSDEVKRTNRIGVSFTGAHEFMLKFFNLTFREALDERREKAQEFWQFLAECKRIVVKTAKDYSHELGVAVPHTDSTVKPAGSTSCLFNLTQGIHLPSMKRYLRWVQFPIDHEMVAEYEKKGYPVRRDLIQYKNTAIVGFPTKTEICRLAEEMGVEDKIVTAGEATMEEQFKWLWLLEKYWIQGVDEQGNPLPDTGNQISATIKFKPENMDINLFRQTIMEWQPKIRCCSVMPQTSDIAYEYQPEEAITREEYDALVARIERTEEDVDLIHVQCEGGACPIDFTK